MKGTLTVVLTLALIIPITAWAADANDPYQDASMTENTGLFGEDLSVTVGLKIWSANIEFADGYEASSAMYGPSINVTFKEKFYAGLNYYKGDGFDYDIDGNYVYVSDGEDVYEFEVEDFNGEVAKTDFDLWAGYNFHHRGSVFLGYKHSKFDKNVSADLVNYTGTKYSEDYESIFKGPVIGLSGNYPIGSSSFVLFGTWGYGFFEFETDYTLKLYDSETTYAKKSGDDSSDFRGFSLEFGVSYFFPKFPQAGLTGGYKYQSYVNTDDEDIELKFSGFTFGANYRF